MEAFLKFAAQQALTETTTFLPFPVEATNRGVDKEKKHNTHTHTHQSQDDLLLLKRINRVKDPYAPPIKP